MRSSNGSNLPPDVDRNRNQTRMTLRRLPDRPLDRQGGIGRELETQSVVEPLDRPGECQVPFYRQGASKPIIDEIDRILAKHYGFTDEELDFIINYDIKYRMGRDNEEGDEE